MDTDYPNHSNHFTNNDENFHETNFLKVKEFHNSFGLLQSNNFSEDLLDPDINSKLIKLRIDLIQEELNELKEAIEQKDRIEVIDALTDILYVTYGAGVSFGANLDKAFSIVHDSNMSKLCKTEEEAINTVEWYKNNQNTYDSPNYRKSDDNKYWVVFNESSGKILKSINFIKPNLSKLIN